MKMIEAAKVQPLIRLILMKHPYAEDIMDQMQILIDRHTVDVAQVMEQRKIAAKDICQCDFCRLFDFGTASAVVENGKYAHVYMATGNTRFLEYEQFRYCPVCGRPNPNILKWGADNETD